ncbi:hypothetical protein [Protofrankia coriariae]|uniref:hypothetical protein n=1 Tax=Protofrankia coriariae TaxID=1562887 RepID=UPI00138F5659|nr:hypothetical protein [Protofrankia coriariae]
MARASVAASQFSRSAWAAARATPKAPAAPRAGAPRTASRRTAATSASTSVTSRWTSRAGSAVWSSRRMPLPVQETGRPTGVIHSTICRRPGQPGYVRW